MNEIPRGVQGLTTFVKGKQSEWTKAERKVLRMRTYSAYFARHWYVCLVIPRSIFLFVLCRLRFYTHVVQCDNDEFPHNGVWIAEEPCVECAGVVYA